MYLPSHFKEARVSILQDFIRRHGLATLVCQGSRGLVASHVPLLFDPAPAPNGTLRGHLARANAHWRDTLPNVDGLAIFSGPQGYVSPNWYASKHEHGKVVPTWNYVAVHAYGPIHFFHDADRLRALVAALTDVHEAGLPKPWSIDDVPPDFIRAHLKGIVGFEMPIARLEGNWKLSQNRPAADRQGVVDGLRANGDAASMALADLVAAASAESA